MRFILSIESTHAENQFSKEEKDGKILCQCFCSCSQNSNNMKWKENFSAFFVEMYYVFVKPDQSITFISINEIMILRDVEGALI